MIISLEKATSTYNEVKEKGESKGIVIPTKRIKVEIYRFDGWVYRFVFYENELVKVEELIECIVDNKIDLRESVKDYEDAKGYHVKGGKENDRN